MSQIAFNSYWPSNMVNVQGDANGISGKGCTGACNAVNTTLTTDAQLQKRGEWLLGALGLAEKLRSPAARCLKASPFICWSQPASQPPSLPASPSASQPPSLPRFVSKAARLFHCGAFMALKLYACQFKPSCLMRPLSSGAIKCVGREALGWCSGRRRARVRNFPPVADRFPAMPPGACVCFYTANEFIFQKHGPPINEPVGVPGLLVAACERPGNLRRVSRAAESLKSPTPNSAAGELGR